MLHLTNVCYFEHLLVVQSLLRFHNTWQINELRRVRAIANVKHGSSRIWRIRESDVVRTQVTPDSPLNLNHTSLLISLAATIFRSFSQSSPGGILRTNCSSKDKSSSSESNSRSYGPRNDIPGAWAAALSLSFSFSFGCGLGRRVEALVERVSTWSLGSVYTGVVLLRRADCLVMVWDTTVRGVCTVAECGGW